MPEPRVGDIWVVRTGGFVAAAIRFLTASPVNHAGIWLAGGMVGEAQPDGYRIGRNHYSNQITIPMNLDSYQQYQIQDAAWRMVGTKYNFLDIAALAVALSLRKFLSVDTMRDNVLLKPLRRRLSRRRRLMCSQAVDQLYLDIGIHLFKDDRLPGEVTPGDLLKLYNP